MNVEAFEDLYLAELQEARSIEAQLSEALPRMIHAAGDGDLKLMLQEHLDETRSQQEQVAAMLRGHTGDEREHRDQSMATLIGEAERWVGMIDDPGIGDAALIASAQRIEHYEIAVYGTLASWAKRLGHSEEVKILLSILDQEKAADDKLTRLAKRGVNPDAAARVDTEI